MVELEHGEAEAEARVLSSLTTTLALSVAILAVESLGAFLSRSLSLTVDAVHNIPDLFAFAVSWAALRSTVAGTTDDYTFGRHRLEVFAALLNASLVLGTGLAFGYAALAALAAPGGGSGSVDAPWVLAAAVPTLALRAASVLVLARVPGRQRSLNLRGVMVHLASDLLITGAILAAGALLLLHPGWVVADRAAALFVSAVLVYESLPLFRDGADVLTERVPRRISPEAVGRSALAVPGVAELHDLHIWSVCPTLVCLTAHVQVREMSLRESREVVAALRHRMSEEFGILHAVFEVELAPAPTPGATSPVGGAAI